LVLPRFSIPPAFSIPLAFFISSAFFYSPRVFLFPPRFFGAPAKLRGDFTGDFFLIRGFFFKLFFSPPCFRIYQSAGDFPPRFQKPPRFSKFFLSPPRKNRIPPDCPRKINDFCLKRGSDPPRKFWIHPGKSSPDSVFSSPGFRVLIPSLIPILK